MDIDRHVMEEGTRSNACDAVELPPGANEDGATVALGVAKPGELPEWVTSFCALVQAGDGRKAAALADKHFGSRVEELISNRVTSRGAASQIRKVVFAKLESAADAPPSASAALRDPVRVRGWLHTTLKRVCDAYVRLGSTALTRADQWDGTEAGVARSTAANIGGDPLRMMMDAELNEEFQDAIQNRLSPMERDVLMAKIAGLRTGWHTSADIGRALGMDETSVNNTMKRIRAKLKPVLRVDYEPPRRRRSSAAPAGLDEAMARREREDEGKQPDLVRQMLDREIEAHVVGLLDGDDRLTTTERTVLRMRWECPRMTCADLSDVLGIEPAAVENAMHGLRVALCRAMGDSYPAEALHFLTV